MASSPEEYSLGVDEIRHMKKMFRRMDHMRQEQKHCDMVICVAGEKIHTNKNVMCAASDYFEAMFSHSTLENQSGVVEMKEVSYAAVKKCVDFIYTGKISTSIEQSEELLYCASLLQLDGVCKKITPLLKSHLNLKSFFDIRRIAGKFAVNSLISCCDEFAVSNFVPLSKEDDFAKLDFEYVCYLLSSESPSSMKEDAKLSAALQWINAEPDARESRLIDLVNLLDMAKISRTYCRFLAENENLCKKSAEFMTKVVLALTAPCDLSHDAIKPSNREDTSISSPQTKKNTSLIVWNMSNECFQVYTPVDFTKVKRFAGSMGFMDVKFTACILHNKLYVLTCEKNVFVLDKQWSRLNTMLYFHGENLQCATLGDEIYVGGENSLEKLNVNGNANDAHWEPLKIAGKICDKSCIVSYDNFIYFIGGYNRGNSLKNVGKYSPGVAGESWFTVPPLNVGRHNAAATVHDGKLYVAGGVTNILKSCSFEMYHSLSNRWTQLVKMATRRSSFRLQVVNDQIHAVGSGTGACSLEVYDTQKNEWEYHECELTSDILGIATVAFCYDETTKGNFCCD